MIVVDASAALELLLGTQRGTAWRGALSRRPERLCAPHLLDVEVLHVLRRYERAGDVSRGRAIAALDDLRELPLHRYPHEPLLSRMWELRNNLTGYDAAYIALAEVLEVSLVTADAKVASSPGHRARVEVL
jgi:predicted nucleic acid-binding protein